jgi:hypothetical protein
MKNLDLTSMGVHEMSTLEMKETNGGNPLIWLIAGIIISEVLDRDSPSDFMEGYNAARKK